MPKAESIPQNIDAEEALLGSLMIDPGCAALIDPIVKAEDFYLQKHSWVYQAIMKLWKAGQPSTDYLLICNELSAKEQLDPIGGHAYIAQLINAVPSALNAESYAQEVAEMSYRRRLLNIATDLAKVAYDYENHPEPGANTIAGKIMTAGKPENGPVTAEKLAQDFYNDVEFWYQNPLQYGQVRGLSTGLKALDMLLDGIKPGLFILAGRASMGKTNMALQLTTNICRQGKRALYITAEMSAKKLSNRMICQAAHVDSKRVEKGWISDSEWPTITQAMDEFSGFDLVIDDITQQSTLSRVRSTIYREHNRKPVDFLVVDYLGLLANDERDKSDRKAENRNIELGNLARHLLLMSASLQIPIFALHQVGRAVESREDKRPQMGDLYESGHLEQHADVVAFVYRDSVYNEATEKPNILEFIVRKNRSGIIGTAELFWGRFAEISNASPIGEQLQNFDMEMAQ